MRSAAIALAALFAAASVGAASADDLFGGLERPRPPSACAPHAHDLHIPGLWLGHFTGGRLTRGPGGDRLLDWRDDYACFPTGRECARWQRSLLRVYHAQEGYRTCLPLRGGGTPIKRREVIRAKY